jgi:putative transposase
MVDEVFAQAEKWRGCGYRRTHDEMRKMGRPINHKKVERLFRLHQLGVPRKKKRTRRIPIKLEQSSITERNQMWAMDFVSDRLTGGKTYRMLTLIDIHTRECLAIEARYSLTARHVVDVLDRVCAVQGTPDAIRIDNGPEFISHALKSWADNNAVRLSFIDPGCPTQNGHIESFNGTLRAECIGLWWMDSMTDVRETVEQWRHRYNVERTHFVIDDTPAAFARKTPSRPFRPLTGKKTKYRPDRKVENAKSAFPTFRQGLPPLESTALTTNI